MNKLLIFLCALLPLVSNAQQPQDWRLVWAEEFDGTTFDTTKWNIIDRGTPHWKRYMTPELHQELIEVKEGNLVLIGRQESDSSFVTGGLESAGKFSFTYGRVDIRAKLGCAQGAWPALWAVADLPNRRWPDDGEIDIMEHLNHDNFVYQTAHSAWTQTYDQKKNPPQGGTGPIVPGDYNVYSIVRTPAKITWLVNGIETFSYAKLDDPEALAKGQWPFDHPFYLILSQQLGGPGTWVGEINPKELPVRMWVDYIRVYEQK